TSLNRSKQRTTVLKLTLIGFLALIILETQVHSGFDPVELSFHSVKENSNAQYYPNDAPISGTSLENDQSTKPYAISKSVKKEYERWHETVRKLSQMDQFPTNWTPDVNWKNHPTRRSKRFPSVDERIKYYMGKWHNSSIPMYGTQFDRDTYIQRQSTLHFADILVNLYDLDRKQLYECYKNKKELQVFAPYCRDYIDIAILHAGGLANVIHFIGDALPSYMPEALLKYPMFAKVRPLCGEELDERGYVNSFCKNSQMVQPIILPLNRKRHYGTASQVPSNDTPWSKKIPKAIWRGKYESVDSAFIKHGSISGSPDMKYALVSTHLNSSLVDAKFSKHNDDAPEVMTAPYMDMKEQLKYRYIISIEGESWAMEGTLQPYVHYIPINEDMSNVEDMIYWAEQHPELTRLISERSTLFIFDLLFHPDAIRDERRVVQGIMEVYENNYGQSVTSSVNGNIGFISNEQAGRSQRFPGVEERVQYYMGKWHEHKVSISMKREDVVHLNSVVMANHVGKDSPFIASGYVLSQCAHANRTHIEYLRRLCSEALPYFDDRNTADLKSNSFKRLLKAKKSGGMKLALHSSWRSDGASSKESKRVLLDDSVKVRSLLFLFCMEIIFIFTVVLKYPSLLGRIKPTCLFSPRGEAGDDLGIIIWPFNRRNILSTSRWIKVIDTDFAAKHAHAISTDGLKASTACMDASSIRDRIQNVLQYRYLLVQDDADCANIDLTWMLFSRSVLIMPKPRCESWVMETKLQPFVHYLPIEEDMSDVEEIVQWAERNLEHSRLVAERSTQYVHDLLFHPDAIRDQKLIMERIMDTYRRYYGG
ncbi:LOW QUALITY PROTEIN: hypothetical protein HJC23_007545, partial [Cyclotella cryptica]